MNNGKWTARATDPKEYDRMVLQDYYRIQKKKSKRSKAGDRNDEER
jgi:hypothetical protein